MKAIILDIEENQSEEEAYWVTYAPPTTNIMYAMPNIGESVRLYFPVKATKNRLLKAAKEKMEILVEQTSDTTNRYFRNKLFSDAINNTKAVGGNKENRIRLFKNNI